MESLYFYAWPCLVYFWCKQPKKNVHKDNSTVISLDYGTSLKLELVSGVVRWQATAHCSSGMDEVQINNEVIIEM